MNAAQSFRRVAYVIVGVPLFLAAVSLIPKEDAERAVVRDPCEGRPGEIDAFIHSQTSVQNALRAPSTASFPYASSDGVRIENLAKCQWRVSAYVDAENAFGGTVRIGYSVAIERRDNGWYARDLRMD